MPAFLSWKATTKSPSGVLLFDCVTSENLDLTSTATEFPVEAGADISDHVRENADKVTLDITISNTPIDGKNRIDLNQTRGDKQQVQLTLPTPPPSHSLSALLSKGISLLFGLGGKDPPVATVLLFDENFSATSETLDALDSLRRDVRLLNVITRDWARDNMIIESIAISRTSEDGSWATYKVSLRRIRIVETRRTTAAVPAEPRGRGKVDAGKKSGATPEKKDSLALTLAGGSGNVGDLAKSAFGG